MSEQTIDMYDILTVWRDAIKNSQPIIDFCLEKYNKLPTIFVGINFDAPPTDDDCPVIILMPGTKIEGQAITPFLYALSIGWSIYNEQTVVIDNVVEYVGIQQCSQLGQLIYETIAQVRPDYPITKMTFEINALEMFPQIVGEMTLETEIEPCIGAELIY